MSASTGRHIVIIDAAAPSGSALAALLGDEGYRATCRDPSLGVAGVAELDPDLILLDPAAGASFAGDELLRGLRADARTSVVPVVLCSASAEAVRRLDGDVFGPGLGLVLHPIDRQELLDEIGHALRQAEGAAARPAKPSLAPALTGG